MPREVQNRVLELVEQVLEWPLSREHCPDWLLRPGRRECGPLWGTVTEIYQSLTGMTLPDEMPVRERRSLDAVIDYGDGVGRVVEVDEAQHFNPHRALTLDHYPLDTQLAFDHVLWRRRSLASTKLRGGGWGKAKPPLFPKDGGRHLQRAFRDMLADLLPQQYEWAPTLRIGHFEVESWLESREAATHMAGLIDEKLRRR